ncbi:MAG: cation transporter [Actinobacteria bacterium]|nr:cation transporter [Actinomycetota bacterium]
MTVEGGIAITAGIVASSVALVGFGLDSVIEGVASVIIIWRFSGHRVFSADAERRAQRLVAVQFFLLAPYVAFESVKGLAVGEHPEVSWVGIALATGSVVLMPMFGTAKERLADRLGSAATKGEGRQNMLCAYLAGALFFGLLGNALLGAWWLDPTVGLLIAAIAVKEGLEAWGGEGCGCVASPLEGVGFAAEGCADDCCAPAGEVPSCGLDHDGLAGQRGRYAEIGRSVVSFDRTSGSLRVELSPSVDHRLVEEAVSVERGCCPFFEIDFDPPRARLRISVAEDAETPALDAIAHALGLAPDAARSA